MSHLVYIGLAVVFFVIFAVMSVAFSITASQRRGAGAREGWNSFEVFFPIIISAVAASVWPFTGALAVAFGAYYLIVNLILIIAKAFLKNESK